MKNQLSFRFWILIGMIALSGFSQGMLAPVIAIIFEQDGVSSAVNGFHATGIYIGVLLASPFMEKPLQKLGYKRIISIGAIIVIIAFAAFPVWKSIWFWFILRLIVGIGDNMLHFGTQTWITSFSPIAKRGRNIALYGLFFGVGFAAGPLMARLIVIHEALPFMISAGMSFLVWILLFFIKNEYPERGSEPVSFFSTFSRFGRVWKYAWVAFFPPFGYGFLEASLNGNFPVFALRIGLDINAVSIILPAFAIGGIVFQLPLGILSDQFGRRKVLMWAMLLGFLSFVFAGLFQDVPVAIFICLFIAGMFTGSTYSLGIAYMADLLPKKLLPAGNLMCSILFSFGSISGPLFGGLAIQYLESISFFYMLSFMLLCLFMLLFAFKDTNHYGTQTDPLS